MSQHGANSSCSVFLSASTNVASRESRLRYLVALFWKLLKLVSVLLPMFNLILSERVEEATTSEQIQRERHAVLRATGDEAARWVVTRRGALPPSGGAVSWRHIALRGFQLQFFTLRSLRWCQQRFDV